MIRGEENEAELVGGSKELDVNQMSINKYRG